MNLTSMRSSLSLVTFQRNVPLKEMNSNCLQELNLRMISINLQMKTHAFLSTTAHAGVYNPLT